MQCQAYDHKSWLCLGWALEKMGDYTQAIEAYNKSLSIEPDQSFAFFRQARCYALLREYGLSDGVLAASDGAVPRGLSAASANGSCATVRAGKGTFGRRRFGDDCAVLSGQYVFDADENAPLAAHITRPEADRLKYRPIPDRPSHFSPSTISSPRKNTFFTCP